MKKGAFIFVLHSHLPYVRKKGKWPHGEEMLFECMAETYIPLLNALHELIKEKYHPQLTLSLTPILLEQLNDAYLKKEFIKYLDTKLKVSRRDIKIYSGPKVIKDPKDRRKHQDLARFYVDFYGNIKKSFITYKKNLVGAFKKLQDKGVLDIITSSATHAYLPLFYNEKNVTEQLKVGIQTYKKYMGRYPRGIWLPECGYRPEKKEMKSGKTLDGLESVLDKFNLHYFFTDSHVFSPSAYMHMQDENWIGPYTYQLPKPALIPDTAPDLTDAEKPTYRPYHVADSQVAVFARDASTSLQVWSAEFGYPGDFYYREFHAKDAISGLQYCRITHKDGLGGKELYDPEKAHERVIDHAQHFVHLIEERINTVYQQTQEYASIVSAYDTELYGHWWFEGVDWLKEVLKRLEKSKIVDISTADMYIRKHPPDEHIVLPESSWGLGGKHIVWMNDETKWIWPIIYDLSNRMQQAALDHPATRSFKRRALNQALRELLLLHSSDWPFLISTVQAKDYATERFLDHKRKCEALLNMAYRKKPFSEKEKKYLQKVEDADNPFGDLDYRKFGQSLI